MPDNGTYLFGPHYGNCSKGILLPFIPYEGTWNVYVRASLYLLGLLYCFMGVAIVADIFMGAIEKITSKTRKVGQIAADFDPTTG